MGQQLSPNLPLAPAQFPFVTAPGNEPGYTHALKPGEVSPGETRRSRCVLMASSGPAEGSLRPSTCTCSPHAPSLDRDPLRPCAGQGPAPKPTSRSRPSGLPPGTAPGTGRGAGGRRHPPWGRLRGRGGPKGLRPGPRPLSPARRRATPPLTRLQG